jgi:cyclopropane-fatty-acyl-phospholipid synthase
MTRSTRHAADRSGALAALADRLAASGANLSVEAPGAAPLRIGARPGAARVVFHEETALAPLLDGDHLALAEAYLRGAIDVDGDWLEVMKVTEHLSLDATRIDRLRLGLRLLLRDRLRYDRESIAFHYDRPPEFFLPWLGRWRCYSHGLYAAADEPLDAAIERKMQRAIDALGLRPGMRVLDMGGGWGCFVEYAGLRGIRVHAITISEVQHRFVSERIRALRLPCEVELVNFREHRPAEPYDGAVFMGTFEHNPDYAHAARWLAAHLTPQARVWADFCAQRRDVTIGRFMKKWIWPGPITYVDPARWVRDFVRAGWNVHELSDDTLSYACTVRDWGDALEANRKALAEQFGEPSVRAFLLFLRGSWRFLLDNRTQAAHVVAGREPLALGASAASGA